jgi:hypothetical protein
MDMTNSKKYYILASYCVCQMPAVTTVSSMDTPYIRRFLQHVSAH